MIVDVPALKAQLNWTDDMGGADDDLLLQKIEAAQAHIESLLGFKIEEQAPIPAPLVEAVTQLAAWWFVQREAVLVGVTAQPIPYGVDQIVQEHRGFTF
jgi:hypothetical protein